MFANETPFPLICATLAAIATGSACGGKLTYHWTVSEGSVQSDSNPNATFDTSSLNFESANQSQSKTITSAVTVTDEAGKSLLSPRLLPSNARRNSSDCLTSSRKSRARVHNCGKRILINEAAQQAASAYDILGGHVQATNNRMRLANAAVAAADRERAHALDEQRALSAAAVLTGYHGTCASADPAQVKLDWVGTDQTSTPEPGVARLIWPATRERANALVSQADQERRVEVYLIPKGRTPGVNNLKPILREVIKDLGCPK